MYKKVVALDAVTASAESSEIGVLGAEKVSLLLTRANHGSGTSTFYVKGRLKGSSTLVNLNIIVDNVVNTNAQTLARAASKQLGADGSAIIGLDLQYLSLEAIVVGVTEGTDGTHSAEVFIEFED